MSKQLSSSCFSWPLGPGDPAV